jgi:hypothetical protein
MDAQLLINHIRTIRVTPPRERSADEPGDGKFVRTIIVRYADESEYEICLTAGNAGSLEIVEQPPAPDPR